MNHALRIGACYTNRSMGGKFASHTSWREKVDNGRPPKVVELAGEKAKRWGGVRMLISCPRDIEALIRRTPKGKLVTPARIRTALARAHKADIT